MKFYLLLLLSVGLVSSNGIKGVEYLLWTRLNPDTPEVLLYNDVDNLFSSSFDGRKRTYFVFHGWNNNGQEPFILYAKTNILFIEDANFISVDWTTLADSPLYRPSRNNLYRVAKQTANFIDFMSRQTVLTPDKIHAWGHSLGGHAAGMTGHYFTALTGKRISRVTGLDPAGVGFEDVESTRRIDKTNAVFVDVIHTNAGTLKDGHVGLQDAVGHVDFYPNGGSNMPGCFDAAISNIIDGFVGCSHRMAYKYFTESMTGAMPFKAMPCESWEAYEAGDCDCGKGCLNMGFHVNQNLQGSYYLRTNEESPYAQG